MTIKAIRLELARTKDHPEGDAGHAYEFRAPLDHAGHLDSDAWHKAREVCVVRHFENDRETELGLLVRLAHDRWVFSYSPEDAQDELIFKFSSHVFAPGAYVSITEHDGVQRTFRVASVTDWHPSAGAKAGTALPRHK